VLISFSIAQSQFVLNTGIHNAFDDNVNNNYLNTFDQLTQFSVHSGYDFNNENYNLQLFYLGSFNYYKNIIARTFHTHSTGLVYSKLYGEESETALNVGANYNLRIGREDFAYFDNSQYVGYLNVKHQLSERTFGKLGYRIKYLGYKELADLNNIENYFFAQVMNFLPSRTTLAFEANLGVKTYTNAPPETTAVTSGMGRRSSTVDDSKPSVIQLSGNARIAQSIFDETGISVTAGYQKNLQQETRYLSSGYIVSDDDLFDDNYGYEGPSFEATLTHILPWSMMGKVSFNYFNKKYVNRPAYDLSDNIKSDERVDNVYTISIILEKEFHLLNGFTVSLLYDYIRNASNDDFYDYKNNVWAISFDLGL
jgi:hypothetical protein